MRFRAFEWDERNVSHIAEHGVTPEEAEEACFNSPLVLKSRLKRYYVLSQSDGGRYLTVIIQPKFGGIARIVTARDMDDAERRRYMRR